MEKSILKKKAEILLSLHTNGKLLILPNIWDPIGARILEAKGFQAVATASSAISSSLGYKDGEKIKRSTLMNILSRIANCVNVPVTADIESGYGESISILEETIHQVLETGVVGINIEDSLEEGLGLRPIHQQCERIAAIREVSSRKGIHLVINARIDCFVSCQFKTNDARIEETIERSKAYSKAGADCVYPMGPGDVETVTKLRERIDSPINILATSKTAPLPVLQQLGINRVSFGPYIFRSCLKKFIDIIDDLHDLKSYDCFGANMMSKDETNYFLIQEQEG